MPQLHKELPLLEYNITPTKPCLPPNKPLRRYGEVLSYKNCQYWQIYRVFMLFLQVSLFFGKSLKDKRPGRMVNQHLTNLGGGKYWLKQ
jgi:hypothetical protein